MKKIFILVIMFVGVVSAANTNSANICILETIDQTQNEEMVHYNKFPGKRHGYERSQLLCVDNTKVFKTTIITGDIDGGVSVSQIIIPGSCSCKK